MKKSFVKFSVGCIFCLCSFITYAQEREIYGIVTTFDSIAVANAEITSKVTSQTVKTDTAGHFTLTCGLSDKIKISAKGFYTEKVKIAEKTKLVAANLRLKPGEKSISYAIGYGHVLNEDKLNAVAKLDKSDVDFSQYSNLYDVIRGRIPGVQIINGDIIIRGINSINSSNAALVVVDGIVSNNSILMSISPTDVKSINVIKDGSAAIYGSRGANGVLIIETKSGKEN